MNSVYRFRNMGLLKTSILETQEKGLPYGQRATLGEGFDPPIPALRIPSLYYLCTTFPGGGCSLMQRANCGIEQGWNIRLTQTLAVVCQEVVDI
jgi:hypothetical protein